jgi:hypothetical protein
MRPATLARLEAEAERHSLPAGLVSHGGANASKRDKEPVLILRLAISGCLSAESTDEIHVSDYRGKVDVPLIASATRGRTMKTPSSFRRYCGDLPATTTDAMSRWHSN